MNANTAILATLALLLNTGAFAQVAPAAESNTSTVKQSEVGQRAEKKDIDEEITNAKLRAATGSKKSISISTAFGYAGASLLNPTSTERPQLNDNSSSADPTYLSGTIGVKYRVSDHDNLSLGFGVQYVPAYVADKSTGEKAPSAFSASSPSLDWSRVFRAGDIQHVVDVGISKYTLQEDVNDRKLNYSLGFSHQFMTSLGATPFEIGMVSSLGQEIYSEYNARGTQYSLSFAPMLEYAFTDKASFRTVYRAVSLSTQSRDVAHWNLADTTESMGFGYAITRDVYVYPNMQWKWNRVAADQTTVGFSTNINL